MCYEKLGLKQKNYNDAKKILSKDYWWWQKNELLFQLNESMINKSIEKII